MSQTLAGSVPRRISDDQIPTLNPSHHAATRSDQCTTG